MKGNRQRSLPLGEVWRVRVCDREGGSKQEVTKLLPVKVEDTAGPVLLRGRKEVLGGELGSGGSGAAVLRGVEEGQHAVALHRGCTLEPPERAYQSQCLSHTLTPVRSEPGGGVGGGVQGISIF